jgi:hypothetical protein
VRKPLSALPSLPPEYGDLVGAEELIGGALEAYASGRSPRRMHLRVYERLRVRA